MAFERLEDILEKMNSGEIELDQSLKLYEEANKLIGSCQTHLQKAEQKIEKLIKGREGELVVDDEGAAQTEPLDE